VLAGSEVERPCARAAFAIASSAAPETSSVPKSSDTRCANAEPASPMAATCTSLVVSGEYAHVPKVLATATSWTFVATNPAARSRCALAGSQMRFTALARSSALAVAVRSTKEEGAGAMGRGRGRPPKCGFSGTILASSLALRATAAMPSVSRRSVACVATRVPRTTRTRSPASTAETFWWIAALAKRVSEPVRATMTASAESPSAWRRASSAIRRSSVSPHT